MVGKIKFHLFFIILALLFKFNLASFGVIIYFFFKVALYFCALVYSTLKFQMVINFKVISRTGFLNIVLKYGKYPPLERLEDTTGNKFILLYPE